MEKDLISIVVPIYNVELYLDKCVKSIINQTYKKLEIILVDDGSPDNCGRMCDKYAEQDKRIKVIHKQNGGVASARDEGMHAAIGEYIMFVDSDDYIEDNTVEILENAARRNNSDLVKFRYDKITNGEHQFYQFEYFPKEKTVKKEDFKLFVYPFFLEGYMMNSMATSFVRRKCIENSKMNRVVSFGEDLLFNLSYIEKINSVTFINNPLYKYCTNTSSITKTKDNNKLLKNFKDAQYIYLTLYEYAQKWGFGEEDLSKLRIRILYEMSTVISKMTLNSETEKKIKEITSNPKLDEIRNKIDISRIDKNMKNYGIVISLINKN